MRLGVSLVLVLAGLTTTFAGPRREQRGPGNPLLPLVSIGQALDGAFAKFLTGQTGADLYRPFREPAPADAATMRALLQRDRVAAVRSVSTEFELVLRREGRPLLYLRTGIAIDSRQAVFVRTEGRSIAADQPLFVTAYPLNRYGGAGDPFARAAASFFALLSTGQCSGVPWADPAELTRGLPEDLRKELVDGLVAGQRGLPALCANINRLDPDETYLRLDDVAHLAMTADGRATGVIRSQFVLSPAGDLTFAVGDYRPFPKS